MKSTSKELNERLRRLYEVQKEIDKLEREAEEIKDEVKAIMGDEEELLTEDYVVSWKSVEQSRFNQSLFKNAYPDLYEKFKVTSASRRFSLK